MLGGVRLAPLVLALVASTIATGGQERAVVITERGNGEFQSFVQETQRSLSELKRETSRRDVPAADGVIRGRVFAADNGIALRRALVSAQGGGRPVVVQTDFEGRFEIRVSPGRWSLAAAKAGFATLRHGQQRAFESVPPIEIRSGQQIQNVDFYLPRGGAISGRVFDELGDPVLDARVRVLRYGIVQGRKQLSSAGIAVTTDDRGVYRLYGLAPGEYYVAAVAETWPLDRGDEQPLKYAPTYYPGSTDISGAQRVRVDIGDEQTNVTFSLLPVRTARVSATVVDATGTPVGPGNVTLMTAFESSDAGGPQLGASALIQPDGSFEFIDVVPGSYTLVARARTRQQGNRGNRTQALAYIPLVVGNDTDLVVTASTGATLTGTVAATNGRQPPPSIRIVAQPLSSAIGFVRLTANSNPDGTSFSMEGLVGPVMLRAEQLPADWTVERIEVNGTEVTDSYIELRGSEQALARVVLTDEVTEVSGRVTTERAASGHHVVIFPADTSKWTFPSRYVRAMRSDDDGTFSAHALPPHDRYFAIAVDYLEEGEANDPDFLQALRASATSFTLRPGESHWLDVKLVER